MRLNPHSIIFKTTVIFVLSLLLLTFGAIALYRVETKRAFEEAKQSVLPIFFSFRHISLDDVSIQNIAQEVMLFGFKEITESELVNRVLEKGVELKEFEKKHNGRLKDDEYRRESNSFLFESDSFPPFPPPLNLFPKRNRSAFELKIYNDTIYLIAGAQTIKPLVFEYTKKPNRLPVWLIYGMILLVLVLAYIEIIKSLLPVKELLKQIGEFSDGNIETEILTKRKDEIAQIAKAFNKTTAQIKELIETRRLFVRNVMHELKTPITSAKLALSMIEQSKYKERLEQIFEREEQILEEFYRVESITGGFVALQKGQFNIQDIVDAAIDLLYDSRGCVDAKVEPLTVLADFSLFSVAIKNLLDNGIKYSPDKKVELAVKNSLLSISNYGEPLSYPLEQYAFPYALKGVKERESRGFGFGLYIALHVCRLHNVSLKYEHKDRRNSFFIDLNPILV